MVDQTSDVTLFEHRHVPACENPFWETSATPRHQHFEHKCVSCIHHTNLPMKVVEMQDFAFRSLILKKKVQIDANDHHCKLEIGQIIGAYGDGEGDTLTREYFMSDGRMFNTKGRTIQSNDAEPTNCSKCEELCAMIIPDAPNPDMSKEQWEREQTKLKSACKHRAHKERDGWLPPKREGLSQKGKGSPWVCWSWFPAKALDRPLYYEWNILVPEGLKSVIIDYIQDLKDPQERRICCKWLYHNLEYLGEKSRNRLMKDHHFCLTLGGKSVIQFATEYLLKEQNLRV